MNGAEYILSFLLEKGVRTVFAYPGGSVLPLYAALCRSGIRVVLTRHEQGAVHAAAGYAKSTGRVGVCLATSGPGATNLVTGIADAYLDSTPVLILTGQVAAPYIGRDAFQEADIMGITIPVTKHNYLIRDVAELPRSLEEAWRVITFPRMGPVLADMTCDLFASEVPPEAQQFTCLLPRYHQNEFRLRRAAADLRLAVEGAQHPLLLAGGGVAAAGASEALRQASLKSGIPVVVTMMGRAIGSGDGFPGLLGMAGVYGDPTANRALADCDVLIAVGTRFSDRTVPDFRALETGRTVIHADPDSAELNKNVRTDVCICCGAVRLMEMLSAISADLPEERRTAYAAWPRRLPPRAPAHAAYPVLCRAVAAYESAHPGSRVVTDVGTHQVELARNIAPRQERGLVTSGGLGAMGFGLPAAIGAAYAVADAAADSGEALPLDARMLLCCGDGGFQMTAQELAILHQAPVPVKIVLTDNRSLGMVAVLPGGEGGQYDLPDNPDFALLAAAYGLPAQQAEGADPALGARLAAFFAAPGSGLFLLRL